MRSHVRRSGLSILAILAMVVGLLPLAMAPVLAADFSEGFDDQTGFTVNSVFFSDGGGDYLGLTGGASDDFGTGTTPSELKAYSGFEGGYLTGMDLDGEGATMPVILDWMGIDISGMSSPEFSGDFAEFFDSPGDIDEPDYIRVQYQVDAGGYVDLLWFSAADFSSTSGPYNGVLREDTDFDGIGEGTALGDAAQTFTKVITGTGSSLDLRLSVSVDSGDEDFAVDNFTVTEGSGGPAPLTIYDLQHTLDASGASPYVGEEVTVTGVVTAVGGSSAFIQDGTGPWSGITLYGATGTFAIGDLVEVTGTVSEYYNLTQISSGVVTTVSSGNALPAAEVLSTVEISQEQWESVLVRAEWVDVVDPDLGYGEWSFDDGSGAALSDDKFYGFTGLAGDKLSYVQGPLDYAYGAFKVLPRDAGDIGGYTPPPPAATTIHEIQGVGDVSPYEGQTVTTVGVVTAKGGNAAFVQDGVGPFSGIYLYSTSGDFSVGHIIEVTGEVDEYYGLTQIKYGVAVSYGPGTMPTPEVLSSGSVADEQWESVLVRVAGVSVTDPDLGNGEWSVDDGSGEIVVNDLFHDYTPALAEPLDFVQGPLNYSYSQFKIEPRNAGDIGIPTFDACGDPFLPIYDIQGDLPTSPVEGSEVWTEGVVTADFQTSDQFKAFYIQDPVGDGLESTSDGVMVYHEDSSGYDVEVGQAVRLLATVDEYNGLTQLKSVSNLIPCGTGSIAPTDLAFPLDAGALESVEGMLVTFPDALSIVEFYNFDRYGEMVLAADRQFQPTNVYAPGSPEAVALAAENAVNRIKLDDGRSGSNLDPARHPNGADFMVDNRFRGGDLLTNVTGVVDYSFGSYKIQPTQGADYSSANPRTAAPNVGGTVKVASYNVLNFFTHLDDGVWDCGPLGIDECRGADNEEEYARQLTKIVAGIIATGADVVGIQEIENDILESDGDLAHDPVLKLVDALNAADEVKDWAWVGEANHYNDYPVRNDIVYRTGSVTPVGPSVALADSAFDMTRPNETSPVGRPPVAQTFEDGTGELFTVVVNHFKSKGSSCASLGDPQDPDGQGNCNGTRVLQSQALMGFVGDLQLVDPDVLIVGDLNSYAMEDPVAEIIKGVDGVLGTDDDFTNLLLAYEGMYAYSYVFDGQLGYLDHALASPSLMAQVTGAAAWNANSDEPDILDYDTSYNEAYLYEPNAYRASDHDPVLVGLTLDTTPPEVTAEFIRHWASHNVGVFYVDAECDDAVDPDPTCMAVINGDIVVEDGQKVLLLRTPGATFVKEKRSWLLIKAPSFELTVTGIDDHGNEATDTAEPEFRPPRRGRWFW